MDMRSTRAQPLDTWRAARVLLLACASLWLSACASPHVALGTHASAKPERVFHLRVVSRKPNQMATALAVELANRGHLVQRFDSQSDADALRTSEHEQNPQFFKPRVYYIHANSAGAPEELTDPQGHVVWQARYQTWGNVALQPDSGPDPHAFALPQFKPEAQCLRLQGQYADSETGLHYNTFRYYDADVGRFISQDPIGLAGGINLYQYAPNPLSWIDPWGWCATVHTRSRRQALSQAKEHAGVPRLSKGGQNIEMNELNASSRGTNWSQMKQRGATSLGRSNKYGKNKWMEHPDGHPDAGAPGVPEHHSSGHIHSTNANGEEIIFTWGKP